MRIRVFKAGETTFKPKWQGNDKAEKPVEITLTRIGYGEFRDRSAKGKAGRDDIVAEQVKTITNLWIGDDPARTGKELVRLVSEYGADHNVGTGIAGLLEEIAAEIINESVLDEDDAKN